jgi:hypothetical protein
VTAPDEQFTVVYQPPPPPTPGHFWIKNSEGPDLHLTPEQAMNLYMVLSEALEDAIKQKM